MVKVGGIVELFSLAKVGGVFEISLLGKVGGLVDGFLLVKVGGLVESAPLVKCGGLVGISVFLAEVGCVEIFSKLEVGEFVKDSVLANVGCFVDIFIKPEVKTVHKPEVAVISPFVEVVE